MIFNSFFCLIFSLKIRLPNSGLYVVLFIALKFIKTLNLSFEISLKHSIPVFFKWDSIDLFALFKSIIISNDKIPFFIKIISSIISPSWTNISSFIDNMDFNEVTIFTKKSEFSNDLKNWKFSIIGLYISMIKLFWSDVGNDSRTNLRLNLFTDLL